MPEPTVDKKIMRGFKNIHFAPYVNGAFQTPQPVKFAKSGEFKLNFETDQSRADDTIVHDSFFFTGGDGKVEVLDLTPDEQVLILGNTRVKGGVSIKSSDTAPRGAFLFEKQFKGSTHKRLYVVYSCT